MKKITLMLIAVVGLWSASKGQTTLSLGDIAFDGYNCNDGGSLANEFSFVILRSGGISSGTVIKFTDNGWGPTAGWLSSEGVVEWTSGSAMAQFSQVRIKVNAAGTGITSVSTGSATVTTTNFIFSQAGDQVFAFQGASPAAGTLITGLHANFEIGGSGFMATDNTNWDYVSGTGCTTCYALTSSRSAKPSAFTTGTDAVLMYTGNGTVQELDNGVYGCTGASGASLAAVRSAINTAANWSTQNTTVYSLPPSCTYAVSSSTTWNGTTWSAGTPNSTTDAIIASSTTPGSFTCKALTINNGVALTINSGATAAINGNLVNNGNGISGTGTVTFASSGTISGNAISFGGTLTVSTGATLTTGSLLTLTSTSNSSFGQIGNSAGSISGNVTVQRYIPGKRAFRFMGHPFSSSQALTALTDDIDITGSGGATNGFTATTTNNPSAFWFDVSAADNSTTGSNPGWTAFTHTNGVGANAWNQYELLRVLVRGTPGQGLSGNSYTPAAVTLDMTGAVNQGTQVVTLTKGSGSTFVSCGNPFPCGVQMNTVAKGSNIGANYYVWDATSGAAGAYVTNAFTLSYALPPFAALFTTASANSNNTLTFEEADKDVSSSGLFKTTAPANWVELLISDSSIHWDRLLVNLDDNSMDVEDNLDAVKLYNPGLDFFTLSKDDVRLAIDVRPYNDGASIPLGLTAYNRYNKYVIKTGMFDIPQGTKLFLHDKYLNKTEELKGGFEYWFDVTADSNSQGNNRFVINMVGTPTNSIIEAAGKAPKMQLIPNPAETQVKVAFDKLEGTAQVKLISVAGQVIYSSDVEAGSGSITIPLHNIPGGIYFVELQGKNARFTEKLIKQ